MRAIPVKIDGLMLICATPPKARVNLETGEIRTGRDGKEQWQVGICVMQDEQADVVQVVVPGEPKGLNKGQFVVLADLTAVPWEQGDRHGITYRATEIRPASTGSGRGSSAQAA